jgi:hypothetical protein
VATRIRLDPGDQLLTATGQVITVDGLDLTTADSGIAYNLTVADLHSYHIEIEDNDTALVHNTCSPKSAVSQHNLARREFQIIGVSASV